MLDRRDLRSTYETTSGKRSLLKVYAQKQLHAWARSMILTPLRVWLYRAEGVRIGKRVFIGLDTWLDDQFPELISIEDDVTISFRVMAIVHDDARTRTGITAQRNRGTVAPITFKRGCYIGAGAIILPGITIGEEAVVAAGSVVTRDVAPRTIVAGVPARKLPAGDVLSAAECESPVQ